MYLGTFNQIVLIRFFSCFQRVTKNGSIRLECSKHTTYSLIKVCQESFQTFHLEIVHKIQGVGKQSEHLDTSPACYVLKVDYCQLKARKSSRTVETKRSHCGTTYVHELSPEYPLKRHSGTCLSFSNQSFKIVFAFCCEGTCYFRPPVASQLSS